MAYKLLHGDDPAIEVNFGVFAKIRRALGTTAFGVNELRVPPNAEGKAHDETETGHEELYCGITARPRSSSTASAWRSPRATTCSSHPTRRGR
jgi:hypothetical protein